MALTEEQREIAGSLWLARDTNSKSGFISAVEAVIAALPKPEAVEIDWPKYHNEAMGCGLKDRNITNRYEAMRHGWECAIEQVADRLLEVLYTEAPIAKPASECQCSMTTKLVGDGCVHCNPEYTTDHEAQPASDYKKLIAQLKDPEIHFPGNFDTAKRANALLMCLCQEAADALSASAPSEQKPRFECWSTNEGDSWYENPEDAELLYDVLGDSPKVGDEFEVMAGWCSVQARYRIVSQKDDDFEVECISHPEDNTAPHPNYKAQRDALLEALEHILSGSLLLPRFAEEQARAAIASVKGGE